MRNLVIMAVAAGLVLPTAASAQQRSPAEQAAWNARLESREAYAAQQRRDDRRDDRREEWRDDRRNARQDRRDGRARGALRRPRRCYCSHGPPQYPRLA